jgi:hypothetical protein
VATPQAARGWAHPPYRHFKNPSCFCLGSAFEVAAFQPLASVWLPYPSRFPISISLSYTTLPFSLTPPRRNAPLQVEARVDALLKFEAAKSFAAGFLTGVGGLWTLPVAVPASVYANWVLQARIAGAIAHLHGHDLKSKRIRTLCLLCLLGDNAMGACVWVGGCVAERVRRRVLGDPRRARLWLCWVPLPSPFSVEKVANRTLGISGGRWLTRPSRAARRFPSTRL